LVLAFLDYLPYSKHLHIVSSIPNVYLSNAHGPRDKGVIRYMDLEAEGAEQFGASDVEQLTWKDLLDTYTCTECGRCQAECPASISGKELSPKYLILDLKDHLLHDEANRLLGKAPAANGTPEHAPTEMVGEVIHDQVLWDCVTCRACMDACPVFIEHVPKIVDMRRHLVMEASRILPEFQKLFDNVEASGNPWRFPRASRADWARDLGIPTLAERPDAEYLFWVGCAGSYDERNVKVSVALARLLERAGVSFAILGTEESCCGDPVRRVGNEYLFQLQAQQNVETLNRRQVRKIVTACPHCFNTFRNEYPQYGGRFEVYHHSEYLARLVNEGRLKPLPELGPKITYHDPCYLGRQNGVYDAPRQLVQISADGSAVEMQRSRARGFCCGGGGGMSFVDEPPNKRVNQERAREALQTGAQVVAVGCPFCMTMMEDGINALKGERDVRVMDLSELLWESSKPRVEINAEGVG
jgi:Fe-S oxidoreductase